MYELGAVALDEILPSGVANQLTTSSRNSTGVSSTTSIGESTCQLKGCSPRCRTTGSTWAVPGSSGDTPDIRDTTKVLT